MLYMLLVGDVIKDRKSENELDLKSIKLPVTSPVCLFWTVGGKSHRHREAGYTLSPVRKHI